MNSWKEICAKCADGEIEPECEYYGEPNGCNSPTYQEHPHPDNAAAMREALEFVVHLDDDAYTSYDIAVAVQKARDALSAPPRNCDNYDNKTDAEIGFVEETGEDDRNPLYWQLFANWIFATATKRKGESDGR